MSKTFCFQQVEHMIADVDKDGSGAIDFDEFVHMMTAKIGERDTKEDLHKAFNILDQDKNVSPFYNVCTPIFRYDANSTCYESAGKDICC